MKKMAIVDKKGLEYIPNIDRMIREKECRELTTLANSTRWKLEKEEIPQANQNRIYGGGL